MNDRQPSYQVGLISPAQAAMARFPIGGLIYFGLCYDLGIHLRLYVASQNISLDCLDGVQLLAFPIVRLVAATGPQRCLMVSNKGDEIFPIARRHALAAESAAESAHPDSQTREYSRSLWRSLPGSTLSASQKSR